MFRRMIYEHLIKKKKIAATSATSLGLLLTTWIRIITFNFEQYYQRSAKINEIKAVSIHLSKNIHSFLYWWLLLILSVSVRRWLKWDY